MLPETSREHDQLAVWSAILQTIKAAVFSEFQLVLTPNDGMKMHLKRL